LSPYFFVRSEDPSVDRLPLKSTSAAVDVSGVIAAVKVTQVYRNEGKHPLEAVYVFPASTRAAVYGMKMTIGSRTIVAKVREREQARQDYEEAKRQGKSASLLQQERPNVFQMNVSNIMPGDKIRVELSYNELLVPTDGVYEFVYPTVVGPHYSNKPASEAPPSEKWVKSPYLHEGEELPYAFDLKVNIASGIPIKEISSPSHHVDISYHDPSRAVIRLSPNEKTGGNRDFILKYRLAGGAIESGLLLSRGEKENFFLLMLEPPKRVTPDQIPPREYIFVVDVSGSMHGFPLDISKKLLQDLIGHLRLSDRFNVLLFSGGSTLMSKESLPATGENVTRALDVIDRQQGGGGTELLPALKRALAIPCRDGFSRTVVIATDGYVDVEGETFDLIRKSLGDANMFAFGIGTSVNRHLMEGIARAGMGEPFVITKPEAANAAAEKFRAYIQSPVLSRVRVEFGGFDAYDVEPPSVPDVLAERPVVVFGKWRGPRQGSITVRGISGDRKYEKTVKVDEAKPLDGATALRYLWARHRIAVLGDYENLRHNDERVKEITSLGISYNLLTACTSFVAIDSKARRAHGDMTTVRQPLPLPQGVSDLAVGAGNYALPASAPVAMKGMAEMSDYAVHAERPLRAKTEVKKKVGAHGVVDKELLRGDGPKVESLGNERIRPAYLEEIRVRYVAFLKKHPGAAGRISLRLVIGPDGSVKKVSVISSGLKQPALEKDITALVKKWKFPARTGKKDRELVLPLAPTS
jgi:Ca-activated chloride channel family protein